MAIFLKNRYVPQVFLQLFIIFFLKIELEQKVMEASTDGALPAVKIRLAYCLFLCRTKLERQPSEVSTDEALPAFEIRFA